MFSMVFFVFFWGAIALTDDDLHLASTLSERKITQNSLQFSAQSRRNLAFQCNGVQVKQMCQGTNEKAILKDYLEEQK